MLKAWQAPYIRSLMTMRIMWGNPWPPYSGISGRGGPAVFAVKPEGRLELGGAADLAVFQNHPPLFPDFLERGDFRPGKFDGLVDQQVQGLFIEFPVTVQPAEAAVIQLVF